jgi:hypothetical protein
MGRQGWRMKEEGERRFQRMRDEGKAGVACLEFSAAFNL